MFNFELYITKIIGAIFCHVSKIKLLNQFNPSITSGNQKWKGAAPIFVNNAELVIIIKYWFKLKKKDEFIDIIIILNKINIEAKVWVKKYLIDASEEYIFLYIENNGITEIILISNPIHIPSQEYEEIEIKVPIIMVRKNINLYILIKKKRIRTFIYGVWTH